MLPIVYATCKSLPHPSLFSFSFSHSPCPMEHLARTRLISMVSPINTCMIWGLTSDQYKLIHLIRAQYESNCLNFNCSTIQFNYEQWNTKSTFARLTLNFAITSFHGGQLSPKVLPWFAWYEHPALVHPCIVENREMSPINVWS